MKNHRYSCNITNIAAPTAQLVCGHSGKETDRSCTDCIRSGKGASKSTTQTELKFDKIQKQVQKSWAFRNHISEGEPDAETKT